MLTMPIHDNHEMNPKSELVTEQQSFPTPFSIEDLRRDVASVYLHHVRTIAWMRDPSTAATLVPGLEPEQANLLMWEAPPEDLGLTCDRLGGTTLMKALEFLYRYAFLGELDASAEPMEDESVYTWTSALVFDAAQGRLATEWSDHGSFTDDAASRCLMVCELANARLTLEGGEPFYSKFGNYPKDMATGDGSLTVRQMALLAGMEEKSIRAASNKVQKRANPLDTYSTESGTRIALDVAKAWLQSKNRYVPIKLRWSSAEIDLARTRFNNTKELHQALNARMQTRCQRDGEHVVMAQFKARLGVESLVSITDEHYMDAERMRKLGDVLELPADLLVLRCREAVTREALADVERALKQALSSEPPAARA